jgi:Conserved TM helix
MVGVYKQIDRDTPMIDIVQETVALSSIGNLHSVFPSLFAQVQVPGVDSGIVGIVLNLLGAIAILVLGWIIAAFLASIVKGLLQRTSVDEKLADMTSPGKSSTLSVAGIAASVVFWVVMILAVVAALNVLKLTTVSEPLNNFLNQIFAYLPKIGGAAVLAAIAWVVATLSKMLAVRAAQSFNLDDRLTQATETPEGGQMLLSETLGNALYWFVFLFFLPLILGVLDLQGPLAPVQNMLNEFLAALPNIIKAVLIGVVGWFLAKIVRDIVTNLLVAVGTDRMGSRMGLSQSLGSQSLSKILGMVVYVLILIPAAVAALEALQIRSISAPASAMLNQILGAIPQIFTAVVILGIGYFIGQFVKELVTNLLTGLGFNSVLSWLGLGTEPAVRIPPPPPVDPVDVNAPMLIEPDAAGFNTRTPSEVAGIVVLVGVMLFSAVAATNVLGIPALTVIVGGLLVLLGQVLVGLVIFAVGLYLANLTYNIVASSGTSQSKLLGQTAKIAILALVSAMALQQIGIAPNIINLAFGLLLGAIAVAIALAFGLGGRDVAAEQLRDWVGGFKRK